MGTTCTHGVAWIDPVSIESVIVSIQRNKESEPIPATVQKIILRDAAIPCKLGAADSR